MHDEMANGTRAVWASFGGSAALILGMLTGQVRVGPVQVGSEQGAMAIEKVVAVVDYEKISLSIPSAKERREDLKAQATRSNQELDELRTRLAEAEKGLRNLNRLSPEWFVRSEEVLNLRAALENKGQLFEQQMRIASGKHREAIDAQIDAKVAEVAKRLGIKLVLRYHTLSDGPSIADRLRRRDQRAVVYHDDVLDLTDKVIKLMLK